MLALPASRISPLRAVSVIGIFLLLRKITKSPQTLSVTPSGGATVFFLGIGLCVLCIGSCVALPSLCVRIAFASSGMSLISLGFLTHRAFALALAFSDFSPTLCNSATTRSDIHPSAVRSKNSRNTTAMQSLCVRILICLAISGASSGRGFSCR